MVFLTDQISIHVGALKRSVDFGPFMNPCIKWIFVSLNFCSWPFWNWKRRWIWSRNLYFPFLFVRELLLRNLRKYHILLMMIKIERMGLGMIDDDEMKWMKVSWREIWNELWVNWVLENECMGRVKREWMTKDEKWTVNGLKSVPL